MTQKTDHHPGKNGLEWFIFAISSLLLIAIFVFLGRESLHREKIPARLVLQIGLAEVREDGRFVAITVRNQGGEPASEVHVTVSATANGTSENAVLVFDHIPPQGEREGTAGFAIGSNSTTISAHVSGYRKP